MTAEILCTIGPTSLTAPILQAFEKLGISLLRVNLSHTELDDVARTIDVIQAACSVPICLDTEGAQVRTGSFGALSFLERDSEVLIRGESVSGNQLQFTITPPMAVAQLEVGDLLDFDFNGAAGVVTGRSGADLAVRILCAGEVGSNKGVSVNRQLDLPAISQKDEAAIILALERNVQHFALSFCSGARDAETMRNLIGPKAKLISKIESIDGIRNVQEIAELSDALLIDRGDLSRQIELSRIPRTQKYIIQKARESGRPCYVATGFLESMASDLSPTQSEVSDVWNTLRDGASGIVLAAETAVGRHPLECATTLSGVIEYYERQGEILDPIGDLGLS